jgi:hypothetical protein
MEEILLVIKYFPPRQEGIGLETVPASSGGIPITFDAPPPSRYSRKFKDKFARKINLE